MAPENKNISTTKKINVSDCISVKNGQDISEYVEKAKLQHIKCIRIMNGEYRLSSTLILDEIPINLSGESRDGVKLYPISPNLRSIIDGIRIDVDGCVVKNLTLIGFNKSIVIDKSDCIVEHNFLSSYKEGINITFGKNNSVTSNKFVVPNADNMKAICVGHSTSIEINGNDFSGGLGIEYLNVSRSNITRNCFHIISGIAFESSNNSTIISNKIYANSGYSIALWPHTNNTTILDNNINGSSYDDNPASSKNQWDGNYWVERHCGARILISKDIYDKLPRCEASHNMSCNME